MELSDAGGRDLLLSFSFVLFCEALPVHPGREGSAGKRRGMANVAGMRAFIGLLLEERTIEPFYPNPFLTSNVLHEKQRRLSYGAIPV